MCIIPMIRMEHGEWWGMNFLLFSDRPCYDNIHIIVFIDNYIIIGFIFIND